MEKVHGAESWRVSNDSVTVQVARVGAMVAPVTFRLGDREVSPYALAPWLPDEVADHLPGLLKVLRGNFFCFPFGPQEEGPPHGDPANVEWTAKGQADGSLELTIDCGDSGAKIDQRVSLKPGQTAIYYDYRISGLEGKWSYGNHPILDCSHLDEGAARVSVSRFKWASVYPGWFSNPENSERQMLMPGATFEDLSSVPLGVGGTTDLTRYPSRPGFDDLVMMVNEPASEQRPFAWSAIVMDGYVWFSLKNPADFPATLFWLSNGGRDPAPWEGRHLGRIGIEEVCSHFSDAVDRSREETLQGIPTVREFHLDKTTALSIVQAVAEVPAGFGMVAEILPAGDGLITITSESGMSVEACIDWETLC